MKSEAEALGRLTLVGPLKWRGKRKVCLIFRIVNKIGMWNVILVNELGCRKSKWVG